MKHVLLQPSVPAGSLSYLEALTRGRHSEQQLRAEIQPEPSSSQPSSEEQLLLLGRDLASRPAGGGGGSRVRSVSFSLPSSTASPLPASPPRWRDHAREAAVQPWSKCSSCLATRQAPPHLRTLATAVSTTREPPDPAPHSQQHHPLHCQPRCHRPWHDSRW